MSTQLLLSKSSELGKELLLLKRCTFRSKKLKKHSLPLPCNRINFKSPHVTFLIGNMSIRPSLFQNQFFILDSLSMIKHSEKAQKKLPKWLRNICLTKKCVFSDFENITHCCYNSFEEDIYILLLLLIYYFY